MLSSSHYRISLQIIKDDFFFCLSENLVYFRLKVVRTDTYKFFMPVGISGISDNRIFSRSHLATLSEWYWASRRIETFSISSAKLQLPPLIHLLDTHSLSNSAGVGMGKIDNFIDFYRVRKKSFSVFVIHICIILCLLRLSQIEFRTKSPSFIGFFAIPDKIDF